MGILPETNWGIQVKNNAKEIGMFIRTYYPDVDTRSMNWSGSNHTVYGLVKGDRTFYCWSSAPISVKVYSLEEMQELAQGSREPEIINNYQIY